jgi:hypothetical protein
MVAVLVPFANRWGTDRYVKASTVRIPSSSVP